MAEQMNQIANVFFPRATREISRIRSHNTRFAHYTSADTGLKILQSEKIILRNSSLMNDFSEVSHGMDCLLHAYNGPLGNRLKAALRKIQAGLPEALEMNFNEKILDLRSETYLMSLSEHDSGHEDAYGRLSMWRAYASKNGVAFILNNTAFVSESNALDAFTSPVFYAMPTDFQYSFEEVVASVEQNTAGLAQLGANYTHQMLLAAFRMAVQSTKHPAFQEEREWRVIHSPTLAPSRAVSSEMKDERIKPQIMSINSVPQRVYEIPFRNYTEEGFVGATIPELIDRVLIGPSQDCNAIAQAFIIELKRLGVSNAEERVIVTGIPLRG